MSLTQNSLCYSRQTGNGARDVGRYPGTMQVHNVEINVQQGCGGWRCPGAAWLESWKTLWKALSWLYKTYWRWWWIHHQEFWMLSRKEPNGWFRRLLRSVSVRHLDPPPQPKNILYLQIWKTKRFIFLHLTTPFHLLLKQGKMQSLFLYQFLCHSSPSFPSSSSFHFSNSFLKINVSEER